MAFIPKSNGPSRRLAATIIDGAFLSLINIPLTVLKGFVDVRLAGSGEGSALSLALAVGTWALNIFIIGWFYKHKGASPGKLAMRLQVIQVETGARIGYGLTFLRDFIGKWLSALILGIGYLMIAFRKDRRGLHDFIAKTQVVYIPKTP